MNTVDGKVTHDAEYFSAKEKQCKHIDMGYWVQKVGVASLQYIPPQDDRETGFIRWVGLAYSTPWEVVLPKVLW